MAAETDDDRDVIDPCAPPVQPASSLASEQSGPRDIAEASKKRAKALYQNGLTYLQIGRVRDAFGEFKEATRLDPNNREIWQKYEETYREVEAELNAEQAVLSPLHRGQAASSSQPLDLKPVTGPLERNPSEKASSKRPSEKIGRSSALPPTFTFNKPNERAPKDANVLDYSPSEQDARSREIADRMYRGHLTRDAPRQRNDDDLPPLVDMGQRRSLAPAKTLFHKVSKQKVFVANLMTWLVIMAVVVYYYQVDRKMHHDEPISLIGIFFFSILIVCFAAGCWKCVTAEQPIFVSLSDASKIVCGIIIVVCVIWHYSRRPKELQL